MIESQTDLVCRFLPDATLTYVNEALCRFFRRSRDELLGRKFLDFIVHHAKGRVFSHISGIGQDQPTERFEHAVELPDRSTAWVQWVASANLTAKGDVVEIQGIGRDITDRVNMENVLRERDARINLATESANLVLWAYQPATDSAWMSDNGRKLYGFNPTEPLSLASLLRSVHADDREMVERAFNQNQFQRKFEVEHRLIRRNGETNWVITRGRYLFTDQEGESLELIGVAIDVTAQKQATAQLQANREEIAHLSRVAMMGEVAVSLAHELTQLRVQPVAR
jgi:PAS domain S-box-containing protein